MDITFQCIEQHFDYLEQEVTQLLQELMQDSQGQRVRSWGALLWADLRQWHFWVAAEVLLLLFEL